MSKITSDTTTELCVGRNDLGLFKIDFCLSGVSKWFITAIVF